MSEQTEIKIFDDKQVRTLWDVENEKWYIAIVDVVALLTESPNPQVYWRVMKKRLKDEGNETVTICTGLKMLAPDGKMRLTDVADKEPILPYMLMSWRVLIHTRVYSKSAIIKKIVLNVIYNVIITNICRKVLK